jgi:hypothetical protein
MTAHTTIARAGTASWKSTFAAAGIGAAGSLVATSLIALVARGMLDVPAEFQPLNPAVYGIYTIVGALLGAIGWRLIVARSRNAARLLRILVPTVVAASLVPDLALLAGTDVMPGITTTGVVALMLMHVAVAAVVVPAYRRFMPPRS